MILSDSARGTLRINYYSLLHRPRAADTIDTGLFQKETGDRIRTGSKDASVPFQLFLDTLHVPVT